MSKRRGLGKGLAELIPAAAPPLGGEVIQELPLNKIAANPYQPRKDFKPSELKELADSIKAQGLLQPITVRSQPDGSYQLVAGERRLRAVRDLGHVKIKAIVREIDDKQLLELSLVENLLREDLNDIEVAEALMELQDRYTYTTNQLAEVTGKSRPAISNTLRLLELPGQVKQLVRDGSLTAGHGRTVLSFPAEMQKNVAEQCAREGWSVRELERRASAASNRQPRKRPRKSTKQRSMPAALKQAEDRLIEHLGTRVKLTESGDTGTLNIIYHGVEDLERILAIILSDVDPV